MPMGDDIFERPWGMNEMRILYLTMLDTIGLDKTTDIFEEYSRRRWDWIKKDVSKRESLNLRIKERRNKHYKKGF